MAFGRAIDLLLRVKNRGLKSDLRNAQRDINAFGRNAAGGLRSAFSGAIGSFAGFGSIAGLGVLGKGVLDTEEKITRIGIQAGLGADKLDELRTTARRVGASFGLSTDQVVQAADAIVNLEGAAGFSTRKMEILSRASVATGAQLTELAGIGYALNNAFDLKNMDELEGALSAVINAGKNGSVPLGEMATVLQQVAVQWSRVSEKGKAGAADLSAAIQVARKGFGSAAEVGTGIKAFISQLDQAAPKLRWFQVQVFETGKDGKKRLKPLREILDQIGRSELVKNPEKMAQVFGSVEARQFLNMMVANREQFEILAESARNANDVQADSQRFLSSSAGRLKVAIARARTELEGMFTPERIEKFVGLVEKGLVPALDFVLDHAHEIAAVIAGFKIAQATKATWEWAGAVGKLVKEYGGFGKLVSDSKLSVGSLLLSFGRWAGPIGIAATAAWGLYKAIQASREESEQLTEETLRQKELAGEALGPATQFDPEGRAAARREVAERLRKQIEASNKAVFGDFDKRIAGTRDLVQRQKAAGVRQTISEGELDELAGLRERFIKQRGVLSGPEMERFEALLKQAEIIKGDFLGGQRGVEAAARADRMTAEAAAINSIEHLRYGRPDVDLRGLDVRALATQAGLTGEAAKMFEQAFLAQAGQGSSRFVPETVTDERGRIKSRKLSLMRTGLALDDDGRLVQRTETLNPLSLRGLGAGLDMGLAGLGRLFKGPGQSSDEDARRQAQILAEALASSDVGKTLEAAFTNALGALSINIDGEAVFTATQNTQAGRRAPAK
ncbi:phage tail tape measure protein [Haliangium sp.]|uniref:phage tail tape measure protein n=1 Tax=Haliangium sp. TaxID=2663208 RepID=UPI003D0EF19E